MKDQTITVRIPSKASEIEWWTEYTGQADDDWDIRKGNVTAIVYDCTGIPSSGMIFTLKEYEFVYWKKDIPDAKSRDRGAIPRIELSKGEGEGEGGGQPRTTELGLGTFYSIDISDAGTTTDADADAGSSQNETEELGPIVVQPSDPTLVWEMQKEGLVIEPNTNTFVVLDPIEY